MLVILLV